MGLRPGVVSWLLEAGAHVDGLHEMQSPLSVRNQPTNVQVGAMCTLAERLAHMGGFNVSKWDPAVGQDDESMITQGWGKSVAVSHPFQLGVARTIHISEKTVTSALGPGRLKTR